jgi:CHAT domain-containing protein
VVSLPQTPGAPPLPGAAAEAAVLARLFPSRTELAGPDATIAAVAAALPRFSVVHFGCHGVTVPGRASEGGLQLYDGRLRALDAAALRLPHPQLAVLAACATAQGAVALPDEAIHVTSAFQMAGYPHVIGTLWPVSDKFSAQLAELFYTSLASPARGGAAADPAAALHFAIRDLRDGLAAAPQLWAAHTHTGP